MLDIIYWPISAIMWFWYEVLSFVMNPDSGITWVLSIVLLTMTVKGILVWPTLKQMRSMRKMTKLSPKMQELRQRYKNDQAKMAEETQKLYKEAKVNPLAGCLPMLIQIPVFFGLFHVLRSFNRVGDGPGGQGLSVEENREIANYIFSPEHVQSFLDSRFLGVPLAASMSMDEQALATFAFDGVLDFTRLNVILVAVPLVIFVAVVTHLNARLSLNRQKERQASGKAATPSGDNADMMKMQQDMMGKMMLWMMPALTIFTGWIWTIGLLIYMAVNVSWSAVQMQIVNRKMDAEEEAEEAQRQELSKAAAPKVGQRANVQTQVKSAKATRREQFEAQVDELPAIEPVDRDFKYLSNAERKALSADKRADYDKARERFEIRNPEVAQAAKRAGEVGVGKQWVLDRVHDRFNT